MPEITTTDWMKYKEKVNHKRGDYIKKIPEKTIQDYQGTLDGIMITTHLRKEKNNDEIILKVLEEVSKEGEFLNQNWIYPIEIVQDIQKQDRLRKLGNNILEDALVFAPITIGGLFTGFSAIYFESSPLLANITCWSSLMGGIYGTRFMHSYINKKRNKKNNPQKN